MIAPPRARRPERSPHRRWPGLVHGAMILPLFATGCLRGVDTEYAAVRGDSLNGVSAFVQVLRDTGHATTARRRLPATIDTAFRTIVLFDESFSGLDPAVAESIDRLLAAPGERTVLLVLRDSDAVIAYLRAILADGLDDDRRAEAVRMLAEFEAGLAAETVGPRAATPPFPDALVPCTRDPATGPLEVRARTAAGRTVRIEAAWSLTRRLEPGPADRVVWAAGTEPLLVRQRREDADILVLASAAPLLNGGLVDPGNRALAEELAALLPADGRILVAAAPRPGAGGGAGGDGGGDEDEGAEPSPWRLLRIQPLPWVAIHALAALGLFCWWRSPIFGRPRREDPGRAQDFGHHVDALAGLLAGSETAGADFSSGRLRQWGQEPPRAAGVRRRRPT